MVEEFNKLLHIAHSMGSKALNCSCPFSVSAVALLDSNERIVEIRKADWECRLKTITRTFNGEGHRRPSGRPVHRLVGRD